LRREFLSLIPQKGLNHAGTPALCQPRGGPQRRGDRNHPVAQSRQSNPTCGITGILCYGGGIFLQAIEGGRMAVSDLYGHIQKDRATRTWCCCTTRKSPSAALVAGPWARSTCPSINTHPAQVRRAPELDPYAVSGKVSLALLEELMATASIIGRA
jgi:hypothetical protein